MRRLFEVGVFWVAVFVFVALAPVVVASQIVISPTSDGSLYTCNGCNVVNDGGYVLVAGYIQGEIKFSTALIDAPISKALLTLNPYGLPLFGPTIDVYGYATDVGALVAADANGGTFIGTWTLPTLTYGEDTFFDVTSFVQTSNTPYLAFNLRADGLKTFSSLEYNLGHPSQLLVTTVPEPSSSWFLLFGIAILRVTPQRRAGGKSTTVGPRIDPS